MKNLKILMAATVVILVLSACQRPYVGRQPVQVPTPQAEPIVGGGPDAHGCVWDGGYSWCESKAKCLRSWEEPCDGAAAPVVDLGKACASANGNWLAEFRECENAGKDWCDANRGAFNECGSACRHDPKAEVCTRNCVPVCGF